MPRKSIKPTLRDCVTWAGPFEAYSRRWVSKNFWRVSRVLGTEEDALQECALIFTRCFNAYETTVDNPAWFMSLYKRALANDWHTLSIKNTRDREIQQPIELNEIDHNLGPLSVKLAEASDELRYVLSVLVDAPIEMLSIMFDNRREDVINRAICRLSGIRHGTPDIVGELRRLLS